MRGAADVRCLAPKVHARLLVTRGLQLEEFGIFFLSVPTWMIAAVLGAIAAPLGYGIGSWLKNPRVGSAICLAAAVQLVSPAQAAVRREYGGMAMVRELEQKEHLFAVLFRLHPEARTELAAKIQALLNGPLEQQRVGAQNASAEIVGRYFQQHLLAASDRSIHDLLLHTLDVMQKLKADRPELCVAYHLGRTNTPIDFWPGFVETESNMRAQIIESAVANPSPASRATSVDEIIPLLVAGFDAKKYPREALAQVPDVESLPPSQGCAVAMMFTDVLASMAADQGSYVFKNLLYMAQAHQ